MVTIRPDQLGNEISRILSEYSEKVEKGLETAQKRAASKAVKELKATSPERTPKYALGWRSKKTDEGRVVYNSTSGQLTHLLEKGHALRQGGRTRAIVHIRPVEQSTIREYIQETERVIRNG